MKIAIPTLGRVHNQLTLNRLPYYLWGDVILVCPPVEVKAHREENPGVDVVGCGEIGIGRTRDWILNEMYLRGEEKVLMLDDDLKFYRRKTNGAVNLRDATVEEMPDMIDMIDALLDHYVQVGMVIRQSAGHIDDTHSDYMENNRVMTVHAYQVEAVHKHGWRFVAPTDPDLVVMEDFNMTLQILLAGQMNAIISSWAFGQSESNAEGGCSYYRTGSVQEESAILLSQKYPNVVKLREKTTKTAWAGVASEEGTRTDVTVYWKKAYEIGSAPTP